MNKEKRFTASQFQPTNLSGDNRQKASTSLNGRLEPEQLSINRILGFDFHFVEHHNWRSDVEVGRRRSDFRYGVNGSVDDILILLLYRRSTAVDDPLRLRHCAARTHTLISYMQQSTFFKLNRALLRPYNRIHDTRKNNVHPTLIFHWILLYVRYLYRN